MAPTGEGDGLVVQHGFPVPPPLSRGQTQAMTDGQMFQILTNGQNSMPSYAAQIARDDRWKAILHVRCDAPARVGGRRQVNADPRHGCTLATACAPGA